MLNNPVDGRVEIHIAHRFSAGLTDLDMQLDSFVMHVDVAGPERSLRQALLHLLNTRLPLGRLARTRTGHRQRQTQAAFFRYAFFLADQPGRVGGQSHLPGRERVGRSHAHRQPGLTAVTVVHQRPHGQAFWVGPVYFTRGESRRQLPSNTRRVARVPGVLPVRVPALDNIEMHRDPERLTGLDAALVTDQAGAHVRRNHFDAPRGSGPGRHRLPAETGDYC